jgi:hypothetical protein
VKTRPTQSLNFKGWMSHDIHAKKVPKKLKIELKALRFQELGRM